MNKNSIKKTPNILDGQAKAAAKQDKSFYSRPELRVYGSIRTLTLGSTSRQGSDWLSRRRRSDRSVKENITRIGDHPLGFGVYLFDYKPQFREVWGPGRQFGVMADEVEAVMPVAVSIESDGLKMVDYGMLGIIQRSEILLQG